MSTRAEQWIVRAVAAVLAAALLAHTVFMRSISDDVNQSKVHIAVIRKEMEVTPPRSVLDALNEIKANMLQPDEWRQWKYDIEQRVRKLETTRRGR